MKLKDALFHIWTSEKRNACLTGVGGAGKSTLVKATFSELSKDLNGPIPIYIDLTTELIVGSNQRSIIEIIARDYCGQIINVQIEDRLKELFNSERSEKPGYVLFVDGINELADYSTRVHELNQLARNKNLQIVVCSRLFPEEFQNSTFSKLKISPVATEVRSEKLKPWQDILTQELKELLGIPMFLNLFLQWNHSRNQSLALIGTPGAFLNENLNWLILKSEAQPETKGIVAYALRYFFPSFAYQLPFSFTVGDFVKPFNHAEEYLPKHARYQMLCKNSSFFDDPAELIEMLVQKGIVQELAANRQYRFAHQNYYDFYRSLYVYNECVERSKPGIPEVLGRTRLEPSLLSWIGELMGENDFRDKQSVNTAPSPMELWLQEHCAGVYTPEAALCVGNCIEIMKECRGGHITARFDGLDMTQTRLDSVDLSGSSFENAKLVRQSFEKLRNLSEYYVSPDGQFVVLGTGSQPLQILTMDCYNPLVYSEYAAERFLPLYGGEECAFRSRQSIVALNFKGLRDPNIPIFRTMINLPEGSEHYFFEVSRDERVFVSYFQENLVVSFVGIRRHYAYSLPQSITCVAVGSYRDNEYIVAAGCSKGNIEVLSFKVEEESAIMYSHHTIPCGQPTNNILILMDKILMRYKANIVVYSEASKSLNLLIPKRLISGGKEGSLYPTIDRFVEHEGHLLYGYHYGSDITRDFLYNPITNQILPFDGLDTLSEQSKESTIKHSFQRYGIGNQQYGLTLSYQLQIKHFQISPSGIYLAFVTEEQKMSMNKNCRINFYNLKEKKSFFMRLHQGIRLGGPRIHFISDDTVVLNFGLSNKYSNADEVVRVEEMYLRRDRCPVFLELMLVGDHFVVQAQEDNRLLFYERILAKVQEADSKYAKTCESFISKQICSSATPSPENLYELPRMAQLSVLHLVASGIIGAQNIKQYHTKVSSLLQSEYDKSLVLAKSKNSKLFVLRFAEHIILVDRLKKMTALIEEETLKSDDAVTALISPNQKYVSVGIDGRYSSRIYLADSASFQTAHEFIYKSRNSGYSILGFSDDSQKLYLCKEGHEDTISTVVYTETGVVHGANSAISETELCVIKKGSELLVFDPIDYKLLQRINPIASIVSNADFTGCKTDDESFLDILKQNGAIIE